MSSRSITKNVVILTFINVLMQTLGLLVNVCITRKLGAATVGTVSLIGTVYSLLCIIAGGNVFICTSRLGAEEDGRSGNPEAVLRYAVIFCMSITAITCICAFFFSDFLLEKIAGNAINCPKRAVFLLMSGLPPASLCAAMKGYFNSKRMQLIPACAEVIEFLIKSGVLMFFVQFFVCSSKLDIYTAIALGIISGETAALIFLTAAKMILCKKCQRKATIGFAKFIKLCIPIMFNSYTCAFLSSANDFLMPLTLRQAGCGMNDALAKFGIFEAIVLPVIFFPSCVISSLSAIVLPEVSRSNAECNKPALSELVWRSVRITLSFSIFIAFVFLFAGDTVANIVSGEKLASQTLVMLSPIIPFIYLEIILECIIKGMGRHGFSSLNYLAEYIIRISLLLVCVPLFGFYGVLISYAMSNIISNLSRIIMITKLCSKPKNILRMVFVPTASAIISVSLTNLICIRARFASHMLEVLIFVMLSAILFMITSAFAQSLMNYKENAAHKAKRLSATT